MHATQPSRMEALSATEPLKMSGVAYRSTAMHDFRLSWQSEITAISAHTVVRTAEESSSASRSIKPDRAAADQKNLARSNGVTSSTEPKRQSKSTPRSDGALKPASESAADSDKKERSIAQSDVNGANIPGKPIVSDASAVPNGKHGIFAVSTTKAKETEKSVQMKPLHDGAQQPGTTAALEIEPPTIAVNAANLAAAQTIDAPTAARLCETTRRSGKNHVSTVGINTTLERVAHAEKATALSAGRAPAKENVASVSTDTPAKSGHTQIDVTPCDSKSTSHVSINGVPSTATIQQSSVNGVSEVAAHLSDHVAESAPTAGADLRSSSAYAAQGSTVARTPMVTAGPGLLDVRVFDETHGWLRIHAELGTSGAVNASLTTSATAHEAVRATLPAMASYLISEAVNVSKLAVHSAKETSAPVNLEQAPGQQDGNSAGRDGSRNENGTAQKSVASFDHDAGGLSTADSKADTGESILDATGLITAMTNSWTSGVYGARQWTGSAAWEWRIGNGSWLNMHA